MKIFFSIFRLHAISMVAILFFLFSFVCLPFLKGQQNTTANGIKIPEDFAGMVHAGHTHTEAEYQFIEEMGVSWVLTTFYWGSIERIQGQWDFSGTDIFVETAKNHNKKIVAVLGYETNWIFPESESKSYISPENTPFFLKFVEQIVTRYKGKVDAWQIWNEPNFSRLWKGSKEDYVAFAKVATAKIHEIDPEAMILMGGFNLFAYHPFLKGLFKSGAMHYGGTLSFHPYNINPRWSMNTYKTLQKRLHKKNYKGKIVVTEVGFPTGGWYPNAIPERKLGKYIVKTMTQLAASGARFACWYQLFDHEKGKRDKHNSEDFFGLAFPDFEKKQGADAFPACVKNIAGKTYYPDFQLNAKNSKGLKTFYFEGDDGSKTLILWKKSSGCQKIDLSIDGNNMTLFDAKSCQTRSITNNETLKITTTPIIITWQ